MHYANLHGFGLPSAPIQRKDSKGMPIDRWYFPVPGLAGHYLYSNGDISHSFDSNLTNHGYDWIYPAFSSALIALHLYKEKAKIENEEEVERAKRGAILNAIPDGAIPNPPFTQSFPPIPNLEDSTYIEFLEPRQHQYIKNKWVVTNFIPEYGNRFYLHNNGKAISTTAVLSENGGTCLFNSKEEAQKALDEYRAKWNISSTEIASLPDDIVHKLLEPQIIADTFLLWEVISADNSNFALSDSNTLVHVAYKAHFETFQSALFAKLRYERTHREIKTN